MFPQKTFTFKVTQDIFFQTRHSGELFKIQLKIITVTKSQAYVGIRFLYSAKSLSLFLVPFILS